MGNKLRNGLLLAGGLTALVLAGCGSKSHEGARAPQAQVLTVDKKVSELDSIRKLASQKFQECESIKKTSSHNEWIYRTCEAGAVVMDYLKDKGYTQLSGPVNSKYGTYYLYSVNEKGGELVSGDSTLSNQLEYLTQFSPDKAQEALEAGF